MLERTLLNTLVQHAESGLELAGKDFFHKIDHGEARAKTRPSLVLIYGIRINNHLRTVPSSSIHIRRDIVIDWEPTMRLHWAFTLIAGFCFVLSAAAAE